MYQPNIWLYSKPYFKVHSTESDPNMFVLYEYAQFSVMRVEWCHYESKRAKPLVFGKQILEVERW